jgi:hypothetical protein
MPAISRKSPSPTRRDWIYNMSRSERKAHRWKVVVVSRFGLSRMTGVKWTSQWVSFGKGFLTFYRFKAILSRRAMKWSRKSKILQTKLVAS